MSDSRILVLTILGWVVNTTCAGSMVSAQPKWGWLSGSVASPASTSSASSLERFEKSMIFVPSRYPEGNWKPKNLAFEDAWFTAADGTRLHGWYVPHARPRAVVLYCHGNSGNVAKWSDALRLLHDRMAVSVLGFDYRGYGRSEGAPDEAGILADARAARAWLARRTGVAEKQLVLMGRSLGGAVAIDLAAADGARGLIVESTFTSMPELGELKMPWLSPRKVMKTQLNSLAKIPNYHGPLLQSHGTADQLIPYTMGRQLFEAANGPKRFIAIPNGDHNCAQTAEYHTVLSECLDRW